MPFRLEAFRVPPCVGSGVTFISWLGQGRERDCAAVATSSVV